MKEFLACIDKNKDSFVHSWKFVGIVALVAFLGWWTDLLPITYYGLSFLLLVAAFSTLDFMVLIIFLPFGMTGFRHFFYFDAIPFELIVTIVSLVVSVIIMVWRNVLFRKSSNIKYKFKWSLVGKSILLLAIVSLLATIARHLFYNEPAFPDYADAYQIIYGYAISGILLFLAGLLVLLANFTDRDNLQLFEYVFYFFALYLVGQHIVACLEAFGLDFSQYKEVYYSKKIGWADKNTMCIAIEVTLPFLAYTYSKNFKRFDILFIFGFFAMFVLMGDSRGGQVSLGITSFILLYIVFMNTKKVWRNYLLSLVGLALVATLAIIFVPSIRESVIRLFELGLDLTDREVFWGWVFDYVFKEPKHFLLGGSPAYLFELFPAFKNGIYHQEITGIGLWLCHNTFVTVLAVGGFLGLLVIIFHFVEAVFGAFKQGRKVGMVLFALLFVGFVHGLIDNTFFNVLYTLPYLFVFSNYQKGTKELF